MAAIAVRRSAFSQGAFTVLIVVATVAIAGAATLAWLRVAQKLQHAKPVQVPQIHRVTGVAWDGRVFTSEKAFDRFLRARGSSFDRWSRAHSGPASVLSETR